LLCRPELAVDLARGVVEAVKAPVTVKMRLGWDEANQVAPALAPMLEDAGVAAITVHGRTAAQKFGGQVSHEGIARVVEAVKRVPVIGNGDIKSPADAVTMISRTGCRGVMIGRAALSDPWIFRDTHALLTRGSLPAPPTVAERVTVMNHHFRNLLELRGERIACASFRQRVSWYVKKLGPCKTFHERVRGMTSASEYWQAVDEFGGCLSAA
jgi:nifR3 family TIM-barrel protein